MIDIALSEDDLRVPPANNYEHLKGARKDECSIRVNDQWRICFLFEISTCILSDKLFCPF
ncbi:MAG: type II toxin-antitoxin system RelE/ParE family toxin [Proteobacteria bacterium]|nr:type II toxin-antitoxin system RelE/ParE family toxin [Pseudomonadota bacterium]